MLKDANLVPDRTAYETLLYAYSRYFSSSSTTSDTTSKQTTPDDTTSK